jgi:hypothetical protein
MAERSGNDQFFAQLKDIGNKLARGELPTSREVNRPHLGLESS